MTEPNVEVGPDGTAIHHGHPANLASMPDEAAVDPVCGMRVDPATSKYRSVYDGKTYHFCSAGDRVTFDKDPEGYVGSGEPPLSPSKVG